MRKIVAVTFDLWDTLIQEYPGGSDRLAKLRIERIGSLLNSRGIVHSTEEIGSAYRKTGDFLQLTWSKRRDMPVRDQVLFMLSSIDDKLASKLSVQDLAAVEKDVMRRAYSTTRPGCYQGRRRHSSRSRITGTG